ncbi:MAG: hypothetical protein QNJ14_06185 [Woeseiaceae bacterium]|nr:hypothetical protein [Woeseiaceae bacterium]
MRTRYRSRVIVICVLAGMLSTPASAHEEGVYESLRHIPIGRIFLTADERTRLDKMRGEGQAPVTNLRKKSIPSASASNKDAAGFIVSDSGVTRVWKNGEFVASDSARSVRFPGQVKIKSVDTDLEDGDEPDTSPDRTGDEQD